MSERRLLAVLALLLCLVAGLLLIIEPLRIPSAFTVQWLVDLALELILGLVLMIAGLVAYGGRYTEGGVLALVIGLLILIVWRDIVIGVLAMAGGFMALAADRA